VGAEGTRYWFGNQFELNEPRFAAYGVDPWAPELDGKFEDRNPAHKMRGDRVCRDVYSRAVAAAILFCGRQARDGQAGAHLDQGHPAVPARRPSQVRAVHSEDVQQESTRLHSSRSTRHRL
jgi:hypothetical protein